jgi:hypothetical protein
LINETNTKAWAMVKVDLHNDRKIQQIACEHGTRAIAYWLVFILESKKVHKSNDGWSGPWTLDQFAAMCYDEKSTKKKVRELVDSFVQAGLLDVDGELVRRWYARPSRFLALQQRGGRAEVEAKSKANKQGKDTKQQPFNDKNDEQKSVAKVAYTDTDTNTDTDTKNLYIHIDKKSDPALHIKQYRATLGTAAMYVDKFADLCGGENNTTTQLRDWFYRPLAEAATIHGTSELITAINKSIEAEGFHTKYVLEVLKNLSNKKSKTVHLTAEEVKTVESLDTPDVNWGVA